MSARPGVEVSATGGMRFWETLRTLFLDAFRQVFSRKFLSLEGLAFLYLVLTFSIGMAPSRTDLGHALVGLAAIGAMVFLVRQTALADWEIGAGLSRVVTAFGWRVFTFSILLLMSALAVSIPAAIVGKVFGRLQ